MLDDLAITYLMHLPQLEYTSEAQLFYAFEQAWWHYGDQYQKHDESLRGYKTLAQFISVMVERRARPAVPAPTAHGKSRQLQLPCLYTLRPARHALVA